jgi:uncharacterized protein YdbL (DUF1318 family)
MTTSPDETISRTVKAYMAFIGMAAPDLAERIGLSRTALYNRLANETPWSADEVAHAATALDIPIAVLYSGIAA